MIREAICMRFFIHPCSTHLGGGALLSASCLLHCDPLQSSWNTNRISPLPFPCLHSYTYTSLICLCCHFRALLLPTTTNARLQKARGIKSHSPGSTMPPALHMTNITELNQVPWTLHQQKQALTESEMSTHHSDFSIHICYFVLMDMRVRSIFAMAWDTVFLCFQTGLSQIRIYSDWHQNKWINGIGCEFLNTIVIFFIHWKQFCHLVVHDNHEAQW